MEIKFELNQANLTVEQLTQIIESERLLLSLIALAERIRITLRSQK
jgi:hypothetical protein